MDNAVNSDLEPDGSAPEDHYSFPEENEWIESTKFILKNFSAFLEINGYPNDLDVIIRNRDLTDISLRVHKREAYFKYFHGICISERKRAALQAYWINQFHPFTIEDERVADDEFSCLVNEHFAAYLLIENVFGTCPSEVLEEVDETEPNLYTKLKKTSYYEKLVYSIRYRNIPIDSFVLIAETIVPETFDQSFGEKQAGGWL